MGGVVFIFLFIAFLLYFLPSFVASRRGNPNKTAVFVLNLFLGWSLIGWVVALVWACTGEARKAAGDGLSTPAPTAMRRSNLQPSSAGIADRK
jgi:hypothetical protein